MVDAALRTVNYDDLMALGSDARVEVIDGEIREIQPYGFLQGIIAGNIRTAFDVVVRPNWIGLVMLHPMTFLMGQPKSHLRDCFVPDASYSSRSAIPDDFRWEELMPNAPSIAVEVLIDKDKIVEMFAKLRKYHALGTEEVWFAFTKLNELHIYRHDTPTIAHIYRDPAERIETPLLPGLELTLAQIFEMPDWS